MKLIHNFIARSNDFVEPFPCRFSSVTNIPENGKFQFRRFGVDPSRPLWHNYTSNLPYSVSI